MNKIIVIGGGPAGMFAAIGKGRCNITNAGDMDNLFANVMTNAKFLYSAFYSYDNQRVIDFFERNGLRTKTERGNRVFPVSDHSSDVIATLQKVLKEKKVKVMLHTQVQSLLMESSGEDAPENIVTGVKLTDGTTMPALRQADFPIRRPALQGMVTVLQKKQDIPSRTSGRHWYRFSQKKTMSGRCRDFH